MVFFCLVTTGWVFDISLCENSFNQSINHSNIGCGKREAHIKWSMVTPEKAAPVTGTTLKGYLPSGGGQTAVSDIGSHYLRCYPKSWGLTRWQLMVYMWTPSWKNGGHGRDWQPYPVDPYSAESADDTYIRESQRRLSSYVGNLYLQH